MRRLDPMYNLTISERITATRRSTIETQIVITYANDFKYKLSNIKRALFVIDDELIKSDLVFENANERLVRISLVRYAKNDNTDFAKINLTTDRRRWGVIELLTKAHTHILSSCCVRESATILYWQGKFPNEFSRRTDKETNTSL